jgi:hypothetical protein
VITPVFFFGWASASRSPTALLRARPSRAARRRRALWLRGARPVCYDMRDVLDPLKYPPSVRETGAAPTAQTRRCAWRSARASLYYGKDASIRFDGVSLYAAPGAMEKPRVSVLFDTDGDPRANQDLHANSQRRVDECEFEVAHCLMRGLRGAAAGFRGDVTQLLAGLRAEPFDVVFNLTERFRTSPAWTSPWPAVLEMLGVPYTGADPTG